MNFDWFREWKDGVKELNKCAMDVATGREESYSIMADKLKRIFSQNGIIVENITFVDDGSVITVTLDGNYASDVKFSRELLVDLGMALAVKRKFNSLAENELYIELYPFDGE